MHFGAGGGQFQHFLVADGRQFAGLAGSARVGGVDARDISVNVAAVGLQRRRQGYRRGVRPAAPQGGNVLVGREALKAGDDDQPPLRQFAADPVGIHGADAGLAVGVVGADARLRPAQADGVVAQIPQCHRQQRDGHQLAGGQQQVQFPRVRFPGHGVRQANQLVGGIAHSGYHGDHLMAGIVDGRQAARHSDDFGGVGYRTAAVFMDIQRHRIAMHHPRAGILIDRMMIPDAPPAPWAA